MNTVLEIKNVDLVFGSRPAKGFEALDQGLGREKIQQKTGQVVAVHQANLSVEKGEILVLMGLSGSGKSSLLRCLNGMNGRSRGLSRGSLRGSVCLRTSDGQQVDVMSCSRGQLRDLRRLEISMVFQQFGLMPWRTVEQNVAYPLEIRRRPFLSKGARSEIKKSVSEKLELVGLSAWKDRYPHELSGGMQQRVGLARAFVTQAPILLMDEPFSALDPIHRKHLQDEILVLQKTLKKTMIFVSHDLNEAVRIASRIAVMEAGKILQVATPKELIENPSCAEVRKFTSHLH